MEEIKYKWSEDGGFIIRFCEESALYKLYEIPIFGGHEQHIGNFDSVEEAKKFADQYT